MIKFPTNARIVKEGILVREVKIVEELKTVKEVKIVKEVKLVKEVEILEVNFGILVEVICPASRSQCCFMCNTNIGTKPHDLFSCHIRALPII